MKIQTKIKQFFCRHPTGDIDIVGWASKTGEYVQVVSVCKLCGKRIDWSLGLTMSHEWIKVMGDYKRLDKEFKNEN